jgi:hypothetical protein
MLNNGSWSLDMERFGMNTLDLGDTRLRVLRYPIPVDEIEAWEDARISAQNFIREICNI